MPTEIDEIVDEATGIISALWHDQDNRQVYTSAVAHLMRHGLTDEEITMLLGGLFDAAWQEGDLAP